MRTRATFDLSLPLGMTLGDDGVTAVTRGGQAELAGVRVGFRVRAVQEGDDAASCESYGAKQGRNAEGHISSLLAAESITPTGKATGPPIIRVSFEDSAFDHARSLYAIMQKAPSDPRPAVIRASLNVEVG